MTRRPIRVHIGELVLHGFDPLDRHSIGDAVRGELADVLGAGGFADAPAMRIPRLRAGTVRAGSRRGEGIGTEVARAVQGAFRK